MAPPADLLGTTLASQPLPALEKINTRLQDATSKASAPVKRIQSDTDLAHWRRTRSYHDVSLFAARLAEASVGHETNWPSQRPSDRLSQHASVQSIARLLGDLRRWVMEIEPKAGAQRFGNLAFRDWGSRLEDQSETLHRRLIESKPHLEPFMIELQAYLLDSFGSFVRIDYGSGHEVNFLAWLAYLYRLGFFDEGQDKSGQESSKQEDKATMPTEIERDIAVLLVPMYLDVVWALQDRYGLEPAGSHGVWGLDDYQFLPYIIGAAQLRMQNMYKPSQISLASHKPSSSTHTTSSSTAPKVSPEELLSFVPKETSPAQPPPFANLFTSSIARIHALKKGPFFEHSPLLYDISTSVPNWRKVSTGMMKMWDNEVLGKRPVVQHFVFGAIGYDWDDVMEEDKGNKEVISANQGQPATAPTTRLPSKAGASAGMAPTGAPWAQQPAVNTATLPSSGIPLTGTPWAQKGTSSGLPSLPLTANSRSLPNAGAMLPPSLGPRIGAKGRNIETSTSTMPSPTGQPVKKEEKS
ncbi:unnamed protein product [Sympodiomycopsis kandeliae]